MSLPTINNTPTLDLIDLLRHIKSEGNEKYERLSNNDFLRELEIMNDTARDFYIEDDTESDMKYDGELSLNTLMSKYLVDNYEELNFGEEVSFWVSW